MNLALATGPFAQAVGWALLHLLWQGALVAIALVAALALLRGKSANLRYAVSCAALVLVVVLGVATAIRSYAPEVPVALVTDSAANAVVIVAPAGTPLVAKGIPTSELWLDRVRELRRAADDALPVLVTLWLLGVAAFSLRLIVDWLRAQRLVARSVVPAPEPWQAAALRLGRALGVRRVVRLLESSAVGVPSVIGLVRPAILLPASALLGLSPSQLEMILAHELAHIRRHDYLVNLLQSVVETLLFYHPAVWWISRRVRDEREHCCDDLAVAVCGNPLLYARALARLEEIRADELPLAASANGGSLFERVRRIAGGSTGRVDTGSSARGAAAASAVFCVLVALATFTVPAVGDWVPVAKVRPGATPSSVEPVERAGTLTEPVAARVADAVEAYVTPPRDLPPSVSAFAAPSELPVAVINAEAIEAAGQEEAEAEAEVDVETSTEAAPRVEGKPTLDELIELKVHNVTPETIHAMRALFPGVSTKEIVGMKAVGATPEFVRAIRAEGLEVRTAQEASGLAAVGVSPDFVRSIRAAGLAVRNANEAQGLAAVGVSPDYIREMRSTGLAVESAQEAQGLAALGVTAAFVREMRAAGLNVESAEEAQGLAAVGVTREFVRGMTQAGLAVKSVAHAQGLAAVGVTPDYVRRMRQLGVKIGSAEEAQSLRALGVTPDFVERLARAGYANLTAQELSRLAAAGVTGDFIRDMAKYRTR